MPEPTSTSPLHYAQSPHSTFDGRYLIWASAAAIAFCATTFSIWPDGISQLRNPFIQDRLLHFAVPLLVAFAPLGRMWARVAQFALAAIAVGCTFDLVASAQIRESELYAGSSPLTAVWAYLPPLAIGVASYAIARRQEPAAPPSRRLFLLAASAALATIAATKGPNPMHPIRDYLPLLTLITFAFACTLGLIGLRRIGWAIAAAAVLRLLVTAWTTFPSHELQTPPNLPKASYYGYYLNSTTRYDKYYVPQDVVLRRWICAIPWQVPWCVLLATLLLTHRDLRKAATNSPLAKDPATTSVPKLLRFRWKLACVILAALWLAFAALLWTGLKGSTTTSIPRAELVSGIWADPKEADFIHDVAYSGTSWTAIKVVVLAARELVHLGFLLALPLVFACRYPRFAGLITLAGLGSVSAGLVIALYASGWIYEERKFENFYLQWQLATPAYLFLLLLPTTAYIAFRLREPDAPRHRLLAAAALALALPALITIAPPSLDGIATLLLIAGTLTAIAGSLLALAGIRGSAIVILLGLATYLSAAAVHPAIASRDIASLPPQKIVNLARTTLATFSHAPSLIWILAIPLTFRSVRQSLRPTPAAPSTSYSAPP